MRAISSVCLGEKAGAVQVFMESVKPLFAAAAEAGADIVYASSAAVYGEPDDIPIREDAPLLPVSAPLKGADLFR